VFLSVYPFLLALRLQQFFSESGNEVNNNSHLQLYVVLIFIEIKISFFFSISHSYFVEGNELRNKNEGKNREF